MTSDSLTHLYTNVIHKDVNQVSHISVLFFPAQVGMFPRPRIVCHS